jgi:tagaturonate reductase
MSAILQFGTSRFLQAHVDLFVSEALAQGEAIGTITVVQGTDSGQSARRVAAFNRPGGFPVRVRGLRDGAVIDTEQRVTSVTRALQAGRDWAEIRTLAAGTVQVIVSNTGDRGYEPAPDDHAGLLDGDVPPRGFPARLLALLLARYRHGAAPLTLLPCELVANNGAALRDCVLGLARAWGQDAAFIGWLESGCIWGNSLVDRIVSEPIEPVGAVAEPYALWAIEAVPGMTLPCRHPHVVLTDRLEAYERRKLFMLNLGHTVLAEQWLRQELDPDMTVVQAMGEPALHAHLEAVWTEEVMPVFAALGEEEASRAYLDQVRDRFSNPYLAHRIADIAQNHGEKKRRRLLPVVELARQLGLGTAQPRLCAALGEMAGKIR